jgi:cell shape-determining protein MreC
MLQWCALILKDKVDRLGKDASYDKKLYQFYKTIDVIIIMYSVSLLIYIFSFHVDFIDTHIFTSISKLQRLAQVEKEMLKSLEIYIQDSENSGNVISENVQK